MFYNLEQSRFVLDPHNTINIFFVYITTVYCWNYITYLQGKRLISPIASPFFQLFSEKKQQTCFFLSYSSFVLISFFFFYTYTMTGQTRLVLRHLWKSWKCERFTTKTKTQKNGNSDKTYTLKKFKSSLNCHRIKSYKYGIDFKSGNKAEIHYNYFMGSDMMIRSLSRFLWQFITERLKNQKCKYV